MCQRMKQNTFIPLKLNIFLTDIAELEVFKFNFSAGMNIACNTGIKMVFFSPDRHCVVYFVIYLAINFKNKIKEEVLWM